MRVEDVEYVNNHKLIKEKARGAKSRYPRGCQVLSLRSCNGIHDIDVVPQVEPHLFQVV
jgi:hypothetical protein